VVPVLLWHFKMAGIRSRVKKTPQCGVFSGRDFVPRRDVRSMECKRGLPMAEIESPYLHQYQRRPVKGRLWYWWNMRPEGFEAGLSEQKG